MTSSAENSLNRPLSFSRTGPTAWPPRRLFTLALGTFLWINSVPSALANEDSPAQDNIRSLEVDLGGALIRGVLPFDVPFYFYGSTTQTTQKITLRYIEQKEFFWVEHPGAAPGKPACFTAKTKKQAMAPSSAKRQLAQCRWIPEDRAGAGSRSAFEWTNQDPGKATPTFRIAVPPLHANRHYNFEFVRYERPSLTSLDQFSKAALEAVGKTTASAQIATFYQGTPQVPGTAASLRAQLRADLESVLGAELEIAPGSFFDLSADWYQLSGDRQRAFLNAAANAIGGRSRVTSQLTERATLAIELGGLLELVRESPALIRIVRALRQLEKDDHPNRVLAETLLEAHQQGIATLELGSTELGHLIGGGQVGIKPPRVTESSANAQAIAFNYHAFEARLRNLQDLLDTLTSVGGRQFASRIVADGAISSADFDSIQRTQALYANVDRARQRAFSLANAASSISTALMQGERGNAEIVELVRLEATGVTTLIPSSTLGSFKTQQHPYFSIDFGFALAPELDETVPYIGTNIYLRPVNKDAPLRTHGGFLRRFAFTLGLTVDSIDDSNPKTRSDLFSSNSLLLGAGYRLTDSLRIGAGLIRFVELNPDPLLDRELGEVNSYYFSLSFDWDVLGFFKNFGTVFGQGG